jgi:hypothetical protein
MILNIWKKYITKCSKCFFFFFKINTKPNKIFHSTFNAIYQINIFKSSSMLNYLFSGLKEFLLLFCTITKYIFIFAFFVFKSRKNTSKKCLKIQVNHINKKKNPIKKWNELKHKTLNFSRKKNTKKKIGSSLSKH